MAIAEELIRQGYVPGGVKAKHISSPGEDPKFEQSDAVSRGFRALKQFDKDQEEKKRKRLEKFEKKFDMYQTLREAGYEPKDAREAVERVEKGELDFPAALPSSKSLKTRKAELEIDKTTAEIEKIKAQKAKIESEARTGNVKPLDLWKQAEQEIFRSLGGSEFVGIDDERTEQFLPAIQKRYKELKKEFDVSGGGTGSSKEKVLEKTGDPRTDYNAARNSGLSVEEAKKFAGI